MRFSVGKLNSTVGVASNSVGQCKSYPRLVLQKGPPLPAYACDAAIPPTWRPGHTGRLSARAEISLQQQTKSSAAWTKLRNSVSTAVVTVVLLKLSIMHENLEAFTPSEKLHRKSIFGLIQTGYAETKAQQHRLTRQETLSRGGGQQPLFQEKSIYHHNGSNSHARPLSSTGHLQPSSPDQP